MNKRIKFVYWRGHVCRVWSQFYDGCLKIEHTVEGIPSYYFLVWSNEYQIACYE